MDPRNLVTDHPSLATDLQSQAMDHPHQAMDLLQVPDTAVLPPFLAASAAASAERAVLQAAVTAALVLLATQGSLSFLQ